eukprot:2310157-Pyramimonas_sp.AAC.1
MRPSFVVVCLLVLLTYQGGPKAGRRKKDQTEEGPDGGGSAEVRSALQMAYFVNICELKCENT